MKLMLSRRKWMMDWHPFNWDSCPSESSACGYFFSHNKQVPPQLNTTLFDNWRHHRERRPPHPIPLHSPAASTHPNPKIKKERYPNKCKKTKKKNIEKDIQPHPYHTCPKLERWDPQPSKHNFQKRCTYWSSRQTTGSKYLEDLQRHLALLKRKNF